MMTDQFIGKSAGRICFTDFIASNFQLNQVKEEAQLIWESGRSAWTLLSQDVSGITRWLSPDETQVAMLVEDGIHLEEIV